MAALTAATASTAGQITKRYTLLGKPAICHKRVIKIPPDTTVLKKAVTIGVISKEPILLIFIVAIVRAISVTINAPAGSEIKLPYGKPDFDVNTSIKAATKPMPNVWEMLGFVSKIATQYAAIIQFGVIPAKLGLTKCKIVPNASIKVLTVTHLNCPP